MLEKIYGVIGEKYIEFYTVIETKDGKIFRATRFGVWSKGLQKTLDIWQDAISDFTKDIPSLANETIEMIAEDDFNDMERLPA